MARTSTRESHMQNSHDNRNLLGNICAHLRISASAFVFVALATNAAYAAAAEPLKLLGRTEVPNFEGDFDHVAADVKGNRLFLAGEEKGTLEVFDLASGKHLKTVKGFEEPHAIHFIPDANRLVVTDSGDGMS